MADFSSELQSLKLSFPFMEADPSMEEMSQAEDLNPSLFHDFQNMINFQPFLCFENDVSFSHPTPEFSENLSENIPGSIRQSTEFIVPALEQTTVEENDRKRRKSLKEAENNSTKSCVQVCERDLHRKNGSGRGKKMKRIEKEDEEKPKEVVHVRAKRGQATDSHSIAERVRRGKINDRLRHLQDIVPGCYKTMGMAVMLDEIINYVQSLQNQVEFLSMKLTAASSFYDFNSETDASETFQRAKAKDGKEVERRYGGLLASTQARPL